jgi:hypothetical protein
MLLGNFTLFLSSSYWQAVAVKSYHYALIRIRKPESDDAIFQETRVVEKTKVFGFPTSRRT